MKETLYKTGVMLFLLFSFSGIKSQPQTCCNAVADDFVTSYCISMVAGCTTTGGGANCTEAILESTFPGVVIEPSSVACGSESAICASCDNLPSGGLPVELIFFRGKIEDYGIVLTWKTGSEVNNEGYWVETSTDGINWRQIDFVAGMGTVLYETDYEFIHKRPSFGLNFYRLKQQDYDGQSEYYKTATIVWQGGLTDVQLASIPNPAEDYMMVLIPSSLAELENIEFQIFNVMGQLIRTETHGTSSSIRIDLSDLKSGNYFLKANEGRQFYISKFVKI